MMRNKIAIEANTASAATKTNKSARKKSKSISRPGCALSSSVKKKTNEQKKNTEQQTIIFAADDGFRELLMKYGSRVHILSCTDPCVKWTAETFLISPIEQFYALYERYGSIGTFRWIVVSKAINWKDIENEFNDLYAPMRFQFVQSVREVTNLLHILTEKVHIESQKVIQFDKIVSFGIDNDVLQIEEGDCNGIPNRSVNSSEIWLLKQAQIQLAAAKKELILIFIELGQLQNGLFPKMSSPNYKILYVIGDHHNACLCAIISQKLESSQVCRNLLFSTSTVYYRKFRKHYPSIKVLCLVGFSEPIVQQIGSSAGYFMTNIYDITDDVNLVNVHYNGPQAVRTLRVLPQQNLRSEIERVKKEAQILYTLQAEYLSIQQKLSRFLIARFGQQVAPNFIAQLEQLCKIRMFDLNRLEDVSRYPSKAVIAIGRATSLQKVLLQRNLNVSLFETSSNEYPAAVRLRLKRFAQLIQECDKKFFSAEVQTSISSVFLFDVTLQLTPKDGNILYFYMAEKIEQVIKQIRPNTKQIVVMKMEQFSEDRLELFKQMEMTRNACCEVYLQYGNQFIERNKNGDFKFYKQALLQEKIKKLASEHTNQSSRSIQAQQQSSTHLHTSTASVSNKTLGISLFICVPRRLPMHTLASRRNSSYTLLVYSHLSQAYKLVQFLQSNQYIVIIKAGSDSNDARPEFNVNKYRLENVNTMSENTVRQIIDNTIAEFGLENTRPTTEIRQFPTMNAIVLYNELDTSQARLIQMMSVIFGCSRVVPVPRTDYQRIRERFSFRNVYLYSLNLEETDNTVRIHSVADLFAVYMSPYLSNFDISLASIIIPAKFLLAKYIFKAQKKLKNSSSAFCFSQVFDPKGSVASSQSSTGKLLNETSCKILQQTNGKTLSQTNRNRFFQSGRKNVSQSRRSQSKEEKSKFSEKKQIIRAQRGEQVLRVIASASLASEFQTNDPLTIISNAAVFSTKEELLTEIMDEVVRIKILLVAILESEFVEMTQVSSVTEREGIIWVIVTKETIKCFIRHWNRVYVLGKQCESAIVQLFDKYEFACEQTRFESSGENILPLNQVNTCIIKAISSSTLNQQQPRNEVQVTVLQNSSNIVPIQVAHRNGHLIFPDKKYLQCILQRATNHAREQVPRSQKQLQSTIGSNFQENISHVQSDCSMARHCDYMLPNASQKITSVGNSSISQRILYQQIFKQVVYLLAEVRLQRVVAECIDCMGWKRRVVIVLYQSVDQLLGFSQLGTTIVLLDRCASITPVNAVWIDGRQSPQELASRLRSAIADVRKRRMV